jgi:hypothetical protein
MGFFSRRPDRDLEATLIKQANFAVVWFGHALRFKSTNPSRLLNNEQLDLNDAANRTAIREGVVNLINTRALSGDASGQSTDTIISLLGKSTSVLDDAVACTLMAIHAMNSIARFYYEDFPKYEPLREMLDNLAKTACTGAAQTLGSDLPGEIEQGWPHFSKLFNAAKDAGLLLWPDT